jgi:hypothetical protein
MVISAKPTYGHLVLRGSTSEWPSSAPRNLQPRFAQAFDQMVNCL